MKNTVLLFIAVFLLSSYSHSQDSYQGAVNGPGMEVLPFVVKLSDLPQASIINGSTSPGKRGELPDDRFKGESGPYSGAVNVGNVTDGVTLSVRGYPGPNMNGWQPADADIAVGSLYILVATNEQFHIYSRDNNLSLLSSNSLQTFFNRPGKSVFDPKVIYDPWKNRFVMLALEKDNLFSYYWIAVSQTSNPLGSWWVYQLNAHVDGSNNTSNWADYPGLGFSSYFTPSDSTSIVITSNQYNQSSYFQYAKIRILNTKQLYAGSSVGWYDFWNMSDANSSKSFTLKPGCQWWTTSLGTIYLTNTYGGSGNYFTIWRVDNPLRWGTGGGIALVRQSTINVTAYAVPTSVKQPGSNKVDAFDCRTQDAIVTAGTNSAGIQKLFLYTAIPSKYVWTANDTNSILCYYKLNLTDNSVDIESRFGGPGVWFTFPKPAPCYKAPYNNDTVIISFIRGSATLYNESDVIGHDRNGGLSSTYTVQAGTGHYGNFRFGDYSGACIDPLQTGRVWVASMRNKSGGWGTGVGHIGTTPISGISGNEEVIPGSYVLEQNYPNPFNPSTVISFGIPQSSHVTLKVYNTLGQTVSELVNGDLKPGIYKTDFDAGNLTNGVYFYRLEAGNFAQTKKMILLK